MTEFKNPIHPISKGSLISISALLALPEKNPIPNLGDLIEKS